MSAKSSEETTNQQQQSVEKLITLKGFATSQIRTREKLSDTPAYYFLKTKEQEKDIPIIFRIKENDNWDLWWDTSNDVRITNKNDKDFVLNIWVRDITHKQYAISLDKRPLFNCPYVEKCQTCSKKELVSEMKYIEYNEKTEEGDEYYCFPCYQARTDKEIKTHEKN